MLIAYPYFHATIMNDTHKHTNKLINETSVYLLQHAHNPVEWYPWGEEALQKAIVEDKPILVSIGYAACHWCHVMERESFEDERTAELMNKYFVNIKIDREERPDLDHIYMDAVQAMSGSGGWPLNVFLTPNKMPFYGGTYFPPVKAYNRTSWKELLQNIYQLFKEKRDEVNAQAEQLTAHLLSANGFGMGNNSHATANLFTADKCRLMALNILKSADTQWGGFGKAPKFPQTFSIQFLLRHYHYTKDEASLKQALLSIDKMIMGGIYDQIGGGFARYSTDNEWLAPHFEKMLYDNALLVNVLAEAYQLTENNLYKETLDCTLLFIEREMMSAEGGFYSALDADSEGVEGKFYVWTKQEVVEIIGEGAEIFCNYYNITDHGNWEETNIPRVLVPINVFAEQNSISLPYVEALLEQGKAKLLVEREKRVRPQLDDKILLSWNALMITAFCKGYAATGNPRYKSLAIGAINFIEFTFIGSNSTLYHVYKNGNAKIAAFLDDYAYLIQAYIHLQEITGNQNYLESAKTLTNIVLRDFKEADGNYFYYTSIDQNDVIIRKKEVYDGATPSGNGVMVWNLTYLSKIFENSDWNLIAINALASLEQAVIKHPTSFGIWASLMQLLAYEIKEIVVLGNDFLKDLPKLLKKYIPNKILQVSNAEFKNYPLLAGKSVGLNNVFYLCKNYSCIEPQKDIDKFLELV